MLRISRLPLLAGIFALTSLGLAQEAAQPMMLRVGDAAPPLEVSSWVKGKPVKEFAAGKVYVVEFWATWCGPCKVSIPHLTELQKKVGEKATFVGVSIWEKDQKLVAPFVKGMGDKMDYVVAMDKLPKADAPGNEGFMAKRWMEASGQNGIPSAFIVDQKGKIAWVGHPMEMEEPLDQVIAGTWDAAAFADKQAAEMEAAEKMAGFRKRMLPFVQAKNWDEALKITDEMISAGFVQEGNSAKYTILARNKMDYPAALALTETLLADPKTATMGASLKFDVLFTKIKDFDKAYAFGRELVTVYHKDNSSMLNSLAWSIVDPKAKVEKRDVDLAIMAAERSVELEKNYFNLDTLARAWFMKGDKAKAVAFQKEAIALAPLPDKAELQTTLAEYEKV